MRRPRLFGAAVAVTLVLGPAASAAPVVTQWAGASTFGIGFNNPMSAWANQTMWQSTVASVSMREPLEKMGYSDGQLDNMSADEMIAALRGGRPASGAPTAAVVPPPPEAPPPRPVPAVISVVPNVVPAKTVLAKGDLAGLVFPATSATKFKPTRGRLAVNQLVSELTTDPAVVKDITALVELGLKEYDREAAADGLVNDVAGSMAYFVGSCSYVINDGTAPDPEGLALVGRMLQQLLENPRVKKVSSVEKQKLHEFLVGFGTIVLGVYEVSAESKDTATISALKDGCYSFANQTLKLDLRQYQITGFGLERIAP